MLVASDSESDLPVFPFFNPASMHDSHGFLHTFFRMKVFFPLSMSQRFSRILLMKQCLTMNTSGRKTTPFIDLNEKRGIKPPNKDDFTIGKDGGSVCREGRRMSHDGS